MDRARALERLASDDVTVRLEAARAIKGVATPTDASLLRARLRVEPDELVSNVIRRALADVESRAEPPDVVDGNAVEADSSANLSRIRAQATHDAIDMVLHELRPLIGQLEMRVASEFDDYVDGVIYQALESVRGLLDAFEELRDAAGITVGEEINLTEVIADAARVVVEPHVHAVFTWSGAEPSPVDDDSGDRSSDDSDSGPVEVFLTREEPVPTVGSARLLHLIIRNGLRNAIEACLSVADLEERRVVVSWGTTDRDAWVSIVDSGPGLPAEAKLLWEAGKTTKERQLHRGMGLPIMRQAAESMGADLSLQSAETRGTELEVRWRTDIVDD